MIVKPNGDIEIEPGDKITFSGCYIDHPPTREDLIKAGWTEEQIRRFFDSRIRESDHR
jgi:hypothetical protein